MGTEDAHGDEYNAFEDQVNTMAAALEHSTANQPEDESFVQLQARISKNMLPEDSDKTSIDALTQGYKRDGSWWRDNLRPGA